ncbi:dynein axonemal heavy chain 10-like [Periplaneta americana]|uniref:dynein axonemal heavy chain 10-like n=1 Tax=Periplaneta americana TaxID=6978 RepID=UPI0037E8F4FE
MSDVRVEWVKEKALSFLDETDGKLFDDMLEENDGDLGDKIISFLDDEIRGGHNLERRLFFLYKTYYEKVVQEELLVPEPVKKSPPVPEETEEDTEKSEPATPTKEPPEKKGGKKGGAKKGAREPGKKGKGKKKVAKKETEGSTTATEEPTEEEEGTTVEEDEKKSAAEDETTKSEGKPEGEVQTEGESTVEESTGEEVPAEETETATEESPAEEEKKDTGDTTEWEEQEKKDEEKGKADEEEEEKKKDEGKGKKQKGAGKKKEGGKGKGAKKEAAKAGKRGRKSPATLVELIPEPEGHAEPEPEIQFVTRIVEKVVQAPMLHGYFGSIPREEMVKNRRYIYFLRTNEEGIPLLESNEDAIAEMPTYIIAGSCTGLFLHHCQKMLRVAFIPLVQVQFREPMACSDIREDAVSSGSMSMLSTSSVSFKKPSDYRSLSVVLTKDISSRQSELQLIKMRKEHSRDDPASTPIKTELLDETNRLVNVVDWTIRHLKGDIKLPIPHIPGLYKEDVSKESLAKDPKLVNQLEELVMSWERHITKISDTYLAKKPAGEGPIPMYDYWHERESALGILVEQLKSPDVAHVFDILYESGSQIAEGFTFFKDELLKNYFQARDNVSFLFTILRHCEIITNSETFSSITEAIRPLMEGLRMIWILSEYFGKEENMVTLMEGIAWVLSDQAKSRLNITEVLKMSKHEVQILCKDAKKMMRTWKDAFFETRLKIEESGKGRRWEFDKKRLFKETDYIAEIAKNLSDVAKVLCHFDNIFGPQLKSITSDPAQIDAVSKKVEKLVTPLSQPDFDIFDQKYELNWQEILENFYRMVAKLENEASYFIDESFKFLRSSEEALELLLKFKHISTREAIHKQLMSKFDLVMAQFTKEILTIENEFNVTKRNPPLLRNQPPMSGAIFWCRLLFDKLKKPVLKFQEVEELYRSEYKKEAFDLYLSLCKQMKDFENTKFSQWEKKAIPTVTSNLKKNVLRVIQSERIQEMTDSRKSSKTKTSDTGASILKSTRTSASSIAPKPKQGIGIGVLAMTMKWVAKGRGKSPAQIAKAATISPQTTTKGDVTEWTTVTWAEMMKGTVLVEKGMRFEVNFSNEMLSIIAEAELMEQLGFALDQVILNVAVQKDRLHSNLEIIQEMLNKYNSIVGKLNTAELQFLKNHLTEVERHIQPGLTRFTWNSLGIEEYVQDCHQVLKNLTSLVDQMTKLSQEVSARIESLEVFDFFSYKKLDPGQHRLTCKFKVCHGSLYAVMWLVDEPTEFNLPTLPQRCITYVPEKLPSKYGVHSEELVTKNLEHFNNMLLEDVALFQVDTILSVPNVALRPAGREIYNVIVRSIREFLNKLKNIPRWMDGTCIECGHVKAENSDELYMFSFYEDVIRVQVVNDLVLRVQDTAHRLISEVHNFLQRWRRYRNLWTFDKNVSCDKFVSKNPTLEDYDRKLVLYEGYITEIDEAQTYYDIHSVRVNLIPIIEAVKYHSSEWKRLIGLRLADDTKHRMMQFMKILQKLGVDVQARIDNLEEFKFVLSAITTIVRMSVEAELTYRELQERYRNLKEHNVAWLKEGKLVINKISQLGPVVWSSRHSGGCV